MSVINNGGLNAAYQSGLSGLNASSARTAVIANNLSNASNPDYTRKEVDLSSIALDGIGYGVQASTPYRNVNEVLVEDVRNQIANVSYIERLDEVYLEIQQRFGNPDSQGALGNRVRNYVNAISALAESPESIAKQNFVITSAQNMITELSSISNYVQSLRGECDQSIANATTNVNSSLNFINQINTQILQNQINGNSVGDYQDQRDKALRDLAKYVDVLVIPQQSFNNPTLKTGMINITTENGLSLVQGNSVSEISFTPLVSFDPSLTTPAVFTVNGQNISSLITSGLIGADVQMRDVILPNLQNDLDTLTVQLRDSINKIHNLGSGYPPAQSLTGQHVFNTGTATPFTGNGVIRVALIDSTSGNYVEAQDYDLSNAHTIGDVITGLNTLSGGRHISVQLNAANNLVVSSTNPTAGVAIASVGAPAIETLTGLNLGFSHYCGMNDFFKTGSNFIGDGQPITGLTQKISIRSDIVNNPQLMARGQINTALTGPIPGNPVPTLPAIFNGDKSIISSLSQALNTGTVFPSSANISSRNETLSQYASNIISMQAILKDNNNTDRINAQTQLQLAQTTMLESSGVNSQEEISNLIMEQRNYNIAGMVLKTLNDFYDTLLQTVRN